jgi:hypothetical protein
MTKAVMKLGIQAINLNIIKVIYNKPIINIMLNGEKLKPFSVKSVMRQDCPLSLPLCNIVLEFLARAIRKEAEIKRVQIEKEVVKLSLFVDDMILYLKGQKKFQQKTPI